MQLTQRMLGFRVTPLLVTRSLLGVHVDMFVFAWKQRKLLYLLSSQWVSVTMSIYQNRVHIRILSSKINMGSMGYYLAGNLLIQRVVVVVVCCQERGVTTLSQISLDCSGLATFCFLLSFHCLSFYVNVHNTAPLLSNCS